MSKQKIPQLSEDTAKKLLENVFDACEVQPNTVPLSALESYSEYRRERYSFQKILLIVILIIFLALPFCFILPRFSVTKISPDDAMFPQYEVKVLGSFPIKFVSANIGGDNIMVYESDERTYKIQPTVNGEMKIHVHFINHQYNEQTIEISGIDNNPPKLVSDARDGEYIHFCLTDDVLGIDFDSIYAETNSGARFYPESYDKSTGEVVVKISGESFNIYIPDFKNNVLQLVVTIN